MKNTGTLAIDKGLVKQIKVKLWDAVPLCDANCKLWEEICPYDKRKKFCDLRRNYIDTVFTSLQANCDLTDSLKMHQVGMLLMPLYTSLISIKLEIHQNKGNVRGSKGIDPIYKEQRETIKLIMTLLRDLGIDKGIVPPSGRKGSGDPLNGDGDYYDNLLNGGK